ncbi:dethiobiotin synthase [Priestia flexa]|uniref:dethiobiotin synthase n=1 Tax=Priestia flexa TaxID=86664 RepID=UPI0010FBC016|nr:dethiobiotin synthase [Priestia flexa]QCS52910.1 dethiobiotin synthase [Priestia flexa]
MGKGLFITGTGTDVGKTYVTGLLVKKLREHGYDCGYYKPALSGAEVECEQLIPGDAKHVLETAGIREKPENTVSYIYKHAVSPHLAANLEGNPVDLNIIKKDYQKAKEKYDYVVVEGSGGILCPIRWDDQQHILLEDIVKELNLSTIVIADAGLGTINATVLTIEYLRARNIQVKGIIFNRSHEGDVMEEDNQKMVEVLTGVSVIGLVKENDTELAMEAEKVAELFA